MEAAAPSPLLHRPPNITPELRRFLDVRFRSPADLAAAADVEAEIRGRCAELESSVAELSARLADAAAGYSSSLEAAGSALRSVRGGVTALKASTDKTGVREDVEAGSEKMLFEQLPPLATDVARVDMGYYLFILFMLPECLFIIDYAIDGFLAVSCHIQAALKLDGLIGDVEDAVSSSVTAKLKSRGENSEKTHHVAIGYLKKIEDLLASVTRTRPQWTRLISAVDHRVDRSLALLRPQAIVDHQELVNPLSAAAQHHFSKWVENPEFVFALAYKITRDFANLVGYSCREVDFRYSYCTVYILGEEIFPKQIELLQESSSSDAGSMAAQARVLWLNLVDLMISFDKRTQDLISGTGLLLSVKDDDNWQRISVLSVFCDRPDWLEIWAEIERQEVFMDQMTANLSNNGVVKHGLSLIVDKCEAYSSIALRAEFIKISASPIISEFLGCMFEVPRGRGLTALADDNALIKVSQSINAARSWNPHWRNGVKIRGSVFQQEINQLKEFRSEWVDKISTRQWQEHSEEPVISRAILESSGYIQGRLSKLEGGLNMLDFVTLLFTRIFTGSPKFSNGGVERLHADLSVLLPFLPRLSEGLKLLKIDEKQLRDGRMVTDKNWLREHGVRHLTAGEAEKIIKNRVKTVCLTVLSKVDRESSLLSKMLLYYSYYIYWEKAAEFDRSDAVKQHEQLFLKAVLRFGPLLGTEHRSGDQELLCFD
ncbi:hypothetical protein ZWY2020_022438 [Hordeum vulgare]|nr:hypothetical protein ZWY2020_022438 [Hordeum vulgare]